MEVSEAPVIAPENQTQEGKIAEIAAPVENSECMKGAAVSVIQAAPPKPNGLPQEEEVTSNGHTEQLTNGNQEPEAVATESADTLEQLEQPGEQLPAELLQGDSSLTTVASLIEKSAEEPESAADQSAAADTPKKTSAADLADDWETEDAAAADMSVDENKTPAAAPDTPVAGDEPAGVDGGDEISPRKSGRKVKPTEKVLEANTSGDVEESVEAIANELANAAATTPKTAAKAPPKKVAAKEAAAEDEDDKKGSATKKGRPKKKDLDEKVDNVTKLGNNTYYYTGPGGQDSPPPLNSDDEGDKDSARKSARAGKGRNPRLEREDEEVVIPTKVPPKANHNLNPNWLKTAAKIAEKDKKVTPAKKKSPTQEPAVAAAAAEVAEATEAAMETNENPSEPPGSPPKDEELPEFDPEKFTPGYTPKTVKKGDDEYMIVVQGVQDTGLCGKYWGDLSNLPSRRRSKQPEPLVVGESPESSRQRRSSMSSTGSADSPAAKKVVKKAATPVPKSAKKQVTKPETPNKSEVSEAESTGDETTPKVKAEETKKEPEKSKEKTPKGRKRKVDSPAPDASAKKQKNSQADESEGDADNKEQVKKGKGKSTPETKVSSRNAAAVSAALAAGVPAGQQRSVSCVSDTTTQKEVVVECFAPYDDHRWVNIGKERDGMTPDAVQYARALRPPYHLLSFLRIKGHSTKGMSCTDKNTMVFVVLEGEITVILHTTQFNAKKGDSFYIPPKNYYNLINQKAREAELSLIQFQYDGPLPTVNPSSQ